MSLLGKLFAILNLAGLAGFLYMASLDYAKRQSWAYAVFREDLAIRGIPLDDAERDPEGNLLVERMGEQTKKDLFPQGNAVESQEKEVQRVQGEVNSLAGQPAAADRKGLAFYATILMPFAQTNSERERLRACRTYMADDKIADDLKPKFVAALEKAQQEARREPKPGESQPLPLRDAAIQALDLAQLEMARPFVDDVLAALPPDAKTAFTAQQFGQAYDQALAARRATMVKQVDDLFKEALKREPKPEEAAGASPSRNQVPEDRRQRIALLLFNLYGALEDAKGAPPGPDNLEENNVYRRFLTVVGIQEAVKAVREVAQNLDSLAFQVETARGRDRGLFAVEHGAFLDRVRERASQVDSEAALLLRTQQLVAAHEEQLKKRRRDVKQYEEELKDLRAATMKDIASLREKSSNLFDKRLELRDNTEENQKLEKQIRKLEDEVAPRR